MSDNMQLDKEIVPNWDTADQNDSLIIGITEYFRFHRFLVKLSECVFVDV